MSLVAMAHAALWDSIGSQGGMFHVAVLTADLGLVFASLGLYGLRLLRVTLDTLSIGYRRRWPRGLDLLGGSSRGPNTRSLFTTKSAN